MQHVTGYLREHGWDLRVDEIHLGWAPDGSLIESDGGPPLEEHSTILDIQAFLVPEEGLEPPRACAQAILSRHRLPIPTLRRIAASIVAPARWMLKGG
jgi:hypothetical protein